MVSNFLSNGWQWVPNTNPETLRLEIKSSISNVTHWVTRNLRAKQVTFYGLTSPWNIVTIWHGIWTCFLINLCSCQSTRLPAWTNQNRNWRNITWRLATELRSVPHLFTCSQSEPSGGTLLHGRFISLCFRFIQTRTLKKP